MRTTPWVLLAGGAAALVLAAGALGLGLRAQERDSAPVEDPEDAPQHPLWTAPGQCGACHVEASWSLLQPPPKEVFDHAATGFALTGAHEAITCDDCHGQGLSGLSSRCGTCHHDPHVNQFSQACDRCHHTRTWDVPRNFFLHERTRFPLTGVHAALACESCHRPARLEPAAFTPTECAVCHARDLRAATPNHVVAGFTDCAECHTTTSFSGATYTHRFYRLEGAHALADCADCHGGRGPLVFQGLASGGQDCLVCHQADFDSTASRPGIPNHTIGAPFGSDCGRCHQNVDPPRTFSGATIQ